MTVGELRRALEAYDDALDVWTVTDQGCDGVASVFDGVGLEHDDTKRVVFIRVDD